MTYRLGVDIGGTKINFGILNENNAVIRKQSAYLPDDTEYRSVMHFVKTVLDDLLSALGIPMDQIESCGMGVPGTVSADGRTAIKVPNLHWDQAPCAALFENLTGIPTKLVQDSRAAALGEYLAGSGKGKSLLVCITLGTGIGTGIIKDGVIFGGALGSAGELGHVPIVAHGRPCGCGKKGCLENYVAGKGLAMTVNELMPERGGHLTATDVFELAEQGSIIAQKILDDAVEMLGRTLVSLVNLISPDGLLFSGGMSNQKTLFVEPIMEYIRENGYALSVKDGFSMGYASLGEDAPMIGAALLPQISSKSREFRISASIMCADLLHLQDDLKTLEEARIDYLHCDIMDGHFVPNLMLSMEILHKVRRVSSIPMDIHLMVEKPEKYIPLLGIKSGDLVSVHWESTPHVQRAIAMVRESGAEVALALNPSTPIECCRDLLEDISVILIMTVNPGFSGQKMIPQSLCKISRMREFLDRLGYGNIRIEVDGNCSFENILKMAAAGADTFVIGSSSVFDPSFGIEMGMRHLRSLLEAFVSKNS